VREVVGVVRDAKYQTLTETPVGAYYVPLRQNDSGGALRLLVRNNRDAREMLASMTDVVRSLDPLLPLFDTQTLQEVVGHATRLRRAGASFLTMFGGIALMLTAVGMYAVAAHAVSIRTREVGIRMAFGARSDDVSRMFVGEGLSVALIGVLIGLGISAAASRMLTTFLFGLAGTDAATFVGGSVLVIAVVILASYVPARRASRIDPLVALRYE
jgi:ABC-type antimicrobial peptide transport system permease subunit